MTIYTFSTLAVFLLISGIIVVLFCTKTAYRRKGKDRAADIINRVAVVFITINFLVLLSLTFLVIPGLSNLGPQTIPN